MGELLVEGRNWSPLAVCRKDTLMEQMTPTWVTLHLLVGIPVSLASPVISVTSQAFDYLLKLPGCSQGKGVGLR